MTARGSGCSLAAALLTNLSKSSPDHAANAARPFASGCLPWDMRLKVEALMPHSSATCFQVHWRACLSASRAAKKAPPSNLAVLAISLSFVARIPMVITGSGMDCVFDYRNYMI